MIERVIQALISAQVDIDVSGAELNRSEILRIVETAMLPREPMVKGTIVVIGNRVFRRTEYAEPWWDFVDQAYTDWENVCSFGEPITYAVALDQAELSAKAEDWRRVVIGLFEEFDGQAEVIDSMRAHQAWISDYRYQEIAAMLKAG